MSSPDPVQEVTERLSTMLEAVLQRLSKPEFDATALRAQILCKSRYLKKTLRSIFPS
jgi:hypothetical protein